MKSKRGDGASQKMKNSISLQRNMNMIGKKFRWNFLIEPQKCVLIAIVGCRIPSKDHGQKKMTIKFWSY